MKILLALGADILEKAKESLLSTLTNQGLDVEIVTASTSVEIERETSRVFYDAIITQYRLGLAEFLPSELTALHEKSEETILIVVIPSSLKGSAVLKKIFDGDIRNCLYANDAVASKLANLIIHPRTRGEARIYYGLQGDIDDTEAPLKGKVDQEAEMAKFKDFLINGFPDTPDATMEERLDRIAQALSKQELRQLLSTLDESEKSLVKKYPKYAGYFIQHKKVVESVEPEPERPVESAIKSLGGFIKNKQSANAESRAQKAAEKAEEEARKAREKERDDMLRAQEEEKRAAEKAEADRIKAEEKAEAERIKAERKAEEDKKKEEERKRLAAEKAEEERIRAERKAEEDRVKAERKAEEERIKAERKAEEDRAREEEELRRAEQKAKEEQLRAEAKIKAEAESAEAKALAEAEKQAAKAKADAERAEAEKAKAMAEAERATAERIRLEEKANESARKEEERKHQREMERIRAEEEKSRKEHERRVKESEPVKVVVEKQLVQRKVIGVVGLYRGSGTTTVAMSLAKTIAGHEAVTFIEVPRDGIGAVYSKYEFARNIGPSYKSAPHMVNDGILDLSDVVNSYEDINFYAPDPSGEPLEYDIDMVNALINGSSNDIVIDLGTSILEAKKKGYLNAIQKLILVYECEQEEAYLAKIREELESVEEALVDPFVIRLVDKKEPEFRIAGVEHIEIKKARTTNKIAALAISGQEEKSLLEFLGITQKRRYGLFDRPKKVVVRKGTEDIGVFGSEHGVGTTHTCMLMADALRNIGKVAVVELNNSEQMNTLARELVRGKSIPIKMDGYDIFYDIAYAEFAEKFRAKYDFVIMDFGLMSDTRKKRDIIALCTKRFLVFDAAPWKLGKFESTISDLDEMDNEGQVVLLAPCAEPSMIREYGLRTRSGKREIKPVPFAKIPSRCDAEIVKYMTQLITE